MRRIGITGTRSVDQKSLFLLRKVMYATIADRTNKEITFGGAIGIDTWALIYAVEAMVKYDIDDTLLRVIIPDTVNQQPESTINSTKELAGEIIELKNEINAVDNFYSYKIRNQAIVDHSDIILAFWKGNKRSGTYSCMNMVKKSNKKLIVFGI